ncbi:SGNH hydrolase [Thozetella sp. PMI_491]|nr:SGNH hydrolase [Thozetella sp. PMI_491]
MVSSIIFASALITAGPSNVPAFFLAGDSTTAINGGWGNGLLATLTSPAIGLNIGKSGATTKSFQAGGYWKNVTSHISQYASTNDVYVTISFGHNDQKESSGVSLEQYKTNLINFGNQVKEQGGKPLFVSSLTRRAFPSGKPHNADDSLAEQRTLTKEAAEATNATFIDFNRASLNYVNQIGQPEAAKFNLEKSDKTHLNAWGETVFGRMLADLIAREIPVLERWINKNKTLSDAIWAGLPPP